MEVVYPCCCGLDAHKKSITAWVLWAEAKGKSRKEKKRLETFTHDLLQLADWLEQCGVTHVAMMRNSGVLTPGVMGMTPPPFSTATPKSGAHAPTLRMFFRAVTTAQENCETLATSH